MSGVVIGMHKAYRNRSPFGFLFSKFLFETQELLLCSFPIQRSWYYKLLSWNPFHQTLFNLFFKYWILLGVWLINLNSFVNFNDSGVQVLPGLDVQLKDIWSGLVPYLKQVLEALRHQQHCMEPFLLQKCIGSNRGPDPHGANLPDVKFLIIRVDEVLVWEDLL